MALVAVEKAFNGSTTPYTSYDSSKINLGQWIQQYVDAQDAHNTYCGPMKIHNGRWGFESLITGNNITGLRIIKWSNNIYWIFGGEILSNTPRRFHAYWFNKSTNTLSYKGAISFAIPPGGTFNASTFQVYKHTYTTGTVAVSGTAVTGVGTLFGNGVSSDRIAAGARIGFGTTDPTAVTTWYHIASITNDTSLTLTEGGLSLAAGTSYVIEEIRFAFVVATYGLHIIKGVNWDDFIPQTTTISNAVATDGVKAVYHLKDADVVTLTGAISLCGSPTDNQTHTVYVVNSGIILYKFNIRAILSLSSGGSTSAYILKTGTYNTIGSPVLVQATTNHGPGSGVPCIYMMHLGGGYSSWSVARAAESAITAGSTTFVSDNMNLVQTGGYHTTRMPLDTSNGGRGYTSLSYDSSLDRFIYTTGYTSVRDKYMMFQYAGTSPVWDATNDSVVELTFGLESQNGYATIYNQSSVYAPDLSQYGLAYGRSCEIFDGLMVWGTTNSSGSTAVHIMPCADWTYAAGTSAAYQNRLISPEITTTGATQFYRVYVNDNQDNKNCKTNYDLTPEPWRIYYRTSGISDDSGSWTLLNTYDLTGVPATNSIQFMFEFRICGTTMIPGGIFNLCFLYEDGTTDNHYDPSTENSNLISKEFSWRFGKSFNVTTPELTVKLYNAVSGALLLTDDTTTPTEGVFYKSTDGGSNWGSYNTTDKANDTTYVKYVPTSLTDDIVVKPLLTAASTYIAPTTTLRRKCEIVINYTKVGESVTNFPVLLTKENFPTEAYDGGIYSAQNGGGDLKFTTDSAGLNQIPCEVVVFRTGNTPLIEVWIKLDLSNAVNTSIWAWYNNTAGTITQPAASSTYGSQNVWDNYHQFVGHFNYGVVPTTNFKNSITDSTSNGYNPIFSGWQAKGWRNGFVGNDTYGAGWGYAYGTTSQVAFSGSVDYTVSGWIKTENASYPNVNSTLAGKTGSGNGWMLYFTTNGVVRVYSQTTYYESVSLPFNDNKWHHIVGIKSGTAGIIYFDGQVASGSGTINASITNAASYRFELGKYGNGGAGYITGFVDEIKVANTARSAGWVLTEYNNQGSPSTFATPQTPGAA